MGTLFNVTTARYFLEAAQKFIKMNHDAHDLFEIHFFGRITEEEYGFINIAANELNVTCHGYINHDELVKIMNKADVLLVIVDSLPGAERIIAAKIFEYAFSGRFVFALVPEGGEVDLFIKETGCGISCPPRDIEEIERNLETIFIKWKNETLNETYKRDLVNCAIKAYSRDALTAQLSEILASVSKR
jgi:hypothetical protein